MASNTEECAVCSKGEARERVRSVPLQILGRDAAYKRVEWHCNKCGTAYTSDEQAAANVQAEREAKSDALADIGPRDLQFIRRWGRVTQSDLERILGLGAKTVARWESGGRPIPPYIATIIRMVALQPTVLRELAELEGVRVEVAAAAEG